MVEVDRPRHLIRQLPHVFCCPRDLEARRDFHVAPEADEVLDESVVQAPAVFEAEKLHIRFRKYLPAPTA